MKPAVFSYRRPTSVAQVVTLLKELGDDASIISGGQSLTPMMNLRLAQPSTLIDLGGVPGLRSIRMVGDELIIGARVTHQDLADHPLCDGTMDALRVAAAHVGHLPIRTRGTFGGSLAHADAKSEWCVLALALGGRVIVRSTRGVRELGLDDYFVGPYQTQREADEVLLETRLRRAHGAALVEHATRHGDFAAAIVAVAVDLDRSGEAIERAGVAVGGVRGTAVRVPAAEEALIGARTDELDLHAIGRTAAESLMAADDPSYAARIVDGLLESALGRALERARHAMDVGGPA